MIYFAAFQLSWKQQKSFVMDVFFSMFPYVLTILLYNFLWGKVFLAAKNISFISKEGSILYIVIVNSLMNASALGVPPLIREIKDGSLCFSILKPVTYLPYKISIALGRSLQILLAHLLIGTVIFVACNYKEFNFVFKFSPNFLFVPIILFLSLVLASALGAFFQVFSFWLEDSSALLWVYQKLLFFFGGLFFPLEFYPLEIRNVASFLPFQYILNRPAMTVQGLIFNDLSAEQIIISTLLPQISFAIGLIFITNYLFVIGKRRLESYGG